MRVAVKHALHGLRQQTNRGTGNPSQSFHARHSTAATLDGMDRLALILK